MDKKEILKEMLEEISNDYAKMEGTPVYDIPSSVATQTEIIYKLSKTLFDMIDVDKLKGDRLKKFVRQRKGIIAREATFSIGQIKAFGNGEIKTGDIFESVGGIQFQATETVQIIESGYVSVKCTQSGMIGNVGANSIIYIPVTIQGISSVTNTEPTYDGFEAESNESILERYYLAIRTPPTSGNIYHYELWANEVSGVGGARIFPLWNGDNTVKVLIIDADKKPASEEIVNATQTYIDPESNGKGEGQAPIGAYCTVESAEALNLNVTFNAELETDYSKEEAEEMVSKEIEMYLKDIAFKKNYVSFNQIQSIIFNSLAIKDFENYTLNGGNSNIDVASQEVAILQSVNIDIN